MKKIDEDQADCLITTWQTSEKAVQHGEPLIMPD
jgi:hypothetical protein